MVAVKLESGEGASPLRIGAPFTTWINRKTL